MSPGFWGIKGNVRTCPVNAKFLSPKFQFPRQRRVRSHHELANRYQLKRSIPESNKDRHRGRSAFDIGYTQLQIADVEGLAANSRNAGNKRCHGGNAQ